MEWYKVTAQEWYDKRKKWLEQTAEEQRAIPAKKDCLVLMNYLDQFEQVSYAYKPAIMLKDIDDCKGYIPDIMIQLPSGLQIIIDFVNTRSQYYSRERINVKASDLESEGYLYYIAKNGILSGEGAVSPSDFMNSVAESFKMNE